MILSGMILLVFGSKGSSVGNCPNVSCRSRQVIHGSIACNTYVVVGRSRGLMLMLNTDRVSSVIDPNDDLLLGIDIMLGIATMAN